MDKWNIRQICGGTDVPMQVRDMSCFTCFTGVQFSDVAKLRRPDLTPHRIEIVTQKTVDGLKIKLNKCNCVLLDKYNDFKFKDDKAFPVVTNSRMNAYLTKLGELAGVIES